MKTEVDEALLGIRGSSNRNGALFSWQKIYADWPTIRAAVQVSRPIPGGKLAHQQFKLEYETDAMLLDEDVSGAEAPIPELQGRVVEDALNLAQVIWALRDYKLGEKITSERHSGISKYQGQTMHLHERRPQNGELVTILLDAYRRVRDLTADGARFRAEGIPLRPLADYLDLGILKVRDTLAELEGRGLLAVSDQADGELSDGYVHITDEGYRARPSGPSYVGREEDGVRSADPFPEIDWLASGFSEGLAAKIAGLFGELQVIHRRGLVRSYLVMGGALLEAILFGSLELAQDRGDLPDPRPSEALDRWTFGQLIDVASRTKLRETSLLDEREQRSAENVREFRNFVHLAKEVREDELVEESLADTLRFPLERLLRKVFRDPSIALPQFRSSEDPGGSS